MNTALMWRRFALIPVVALTLTASGCFLMTISGFVTELEGNLITSVRTDSMLTTCVQGGQGSENVNCTYFFFDENGIPVSVTSSAQLISEFGLLGVVIDPLIYQIPDDATAIMATFVNENEGGNLEILSGYRSIPIDTHRTLIAEPGTQFVIAELPSDVPFEGLDFTFDLSFEQAASAPTPVVVKPMLALKYFTGNNVFYPPFLPCAHNMADVAGVTIPEAATLQPLPVPANTSGCTGESYLLLGFGVFPCDFDADDDVDADDIAIQASVRNSPALPGDRLDANADGIIDLNDARRCSRQCTDPLCGNPSSMRRNPAPLTGELAGLRQQETER